MLELRIQKCPALPFIQKYVGHRSAVLFSPSTSVREMSAALLLLQVQPRSTPFRRPINGWCGQRVVRGATSNAADQPTQKPVESLWKSASFRIPLANFAKFAGVLLALHVWKIRG